MYRTTNRPNTRIEVADALRGIAVAGKNYRDFADYF